MEMLHQPYSNFNNYNGYGNFNHPNDKPFQFNNYDNRPFSKPKANLDSRFPFSNLNKSNNCAFGKHDLSNPDLDNNKSDYIEFKPGMQDVPGWLKSLRLHKYKLIFSELTYEEMLGLTEQQLEQKNVTKGARHKIIVNIDKLRARQENLVSLEKSIEQEGASGIKQCLNELKAMLSTPMKAFDHDKVGKQRNNDEVAEGDLPAQIMKLIEKVFPYFQNDMITDDEVVSLFLSTVIKCLNHDAFSAGQKQRLIQIKTRVENKYIDPVLKYANGHKAKEQWDANKKMMLFKANNPMYLNNYKNMSNTSLNSNHSSNGFETNGFNEPPSYANNPLNNTHFHHPYQQNGNPIKFNGNSNYSSLNSSTQSFFSKSSQMRQNNLNSLVSPLPLSSTNMFTNNKIQRLNNYNVVAKQNENHYNKHTFNVNAECFMSSKSAEQMNNGKNGGVPNENRRQLAENRFPFGDTNQLGKYSDAFGEFDDKHSIHSNQNSQNNQNDSNKILSPLSSCSLFNACSQIGKFNKIHLNSFDKLSGLESKQSNQLIFGNLLSDASLLKCLEENNSTLANSNAFGHHPKSPESNFDFDEKFDDKLDENHQIYSHIELLSLRMTEQALGSSEFS